MDNEVFAKNIKNLREHLDLSEQKFADLLEISRSTVVNIEAGKNIKSDTINKLCDLFYMYSWKQLNKESIKIDIDLKEQLANHFKDKTSFVTILNTRPTLGYAIEFRVFKTNFLNEFRETNEIRKFISEKFNWYYKSMSKKLNTMSDLLEIKKNTFKGGTYVYRKKQ